MDSKDISTDQIKMNSMDEEEYYWTDESGQLVFDTQHSCYRMTKVAMARAGIHLAGIKTEAEIDEILRSGIILPYLFQVFYEKYANKPGNSHFQQICRAELAGNEDELKRLRSFTERQGQTTILQIVKCSDDE